MSAKHLIVLALVAYVTIQADSLPYGTKGGQSYSTQSYSEPLKGSSSYVASQQFAEPSTTYRQEPVVAAPVQSTVSAPAPVQTSYSYESAPVKGHYQPEIRYEAPRVQQHYESAPVQTTYTQAEPLKSQYVPLVQRQVPYQAPAYQAPTYSAPAYQAPVYQAPAYQAPAYQAPAYQAPAKGEFYQQSFERVPLAQYEAAPAKGYTQSYTQTYSEPLKSSYVAPQMQAPVPVVSAPAQVQAPTVQVESVAAPVKGQSFYQSEQRFESAPVRQVVSPKA